MDFLGKPSTTLTDKARNIFLAFAIYGVYLLFFINLMDWASGQISFKYTFFMSCIYAPLTEELIFRVAPIGLVKNCPKLILPTIILSSALFGWLHHGASSLPIQGVMGFVLSCVYIKNGYSYWSSVALHSMWNAFVLFILN